MDRRLMHHQSEPPHDLARTAGGIADTSASGERMAAPAASDESFREVAALRAVRVSELTREVVALRAQVGTARNDARREAARADRSAVELATYRRKADASAKKLAKRAERAERELKKLRSSRLVMVAVRLTHVRARLHRG